MSPENRPYCTKAIEYVYANTIESPPTAAAHPGKRIVTTGTTLSETLIKPTLSLSFLQVSCFISAIRPDT